VIDEKGNRVPGRKDVAVAVAGAIHLLVRRRESWARVDVGQEVLVMDQPDRAGADLEPRPSTPKLTLGTEPDNDASAQPPTRQLGRGRARSRVLLPWWADTDDR
jgi:hypothetical protein